MSTVSLDRPAMRAAVLVVIALSFGVLAWRLPRPKADTITDTPAEQAALSTNQFVLEVNRNGSLQLNGASIKETARRTLDTDEVRVAVLADSVEYWPELTVIVHLPAPVLTSQNAVIPYAIHGATAGPVIVDSSRTTVQFMFSDVVPGSSISIVTRMPRGSLALSGRAWLNSQTSEVSPSLWWLVGVSIPLLTALILSMLIPKRHRQKKQLATVTEPPSNTSPAAVGLLVEQRIGSRQIAATLLQLAIEGDIELVVTSEGYRIARRRSLEHLTPLEQLIVDELRLKIKPINRQEIIEEAQQHQLFSQKMTEAFAAIYQELEYRGFFIRRYSAQRLAYRFVGLATILLSIGAAALVSLVVVDGTILLPVTTGIFVAGWLTLILSPHLPRLTTIGERERSQWEAFRQFLVDPKPLLGGQEILHQFEEFLPYAVTFGVTEQWLRRFRSDFITIPSWYYSEQDPSSTEQFVAEMQSIVDKVSKTLAASAIPE